IQVRATEVEARRDDSRLVLRDKGRLLKVTTPNAAASTRSAVTPTAGRLVAPVDSDLASGPRTRASRRRLGRQVALAHPSNRRSGRGGYSTIAMRYPAW